MNGYDFTVERRLLSPYLCTFFVIGVLLFGVIPVESSRKKLKHDYMKEKVNKLEENSKNKNICEMY